MKNPQMWDPIRETYLMPIPPKSVR